jgi:hypothetical protein
MAKRAKPAKKTGPPLEPAALQSRLSALRRRLRFVVTFRGVSWLLTVLLATAAVAGLLDWLLHLPGLVRAVILVGALSGSGYILYQSLFRPLRGQTDDLSLALRVEEQYPSLNDGLASSVEFLKQPVEATHESAGLRHEAVRRALGKAQPCDFNKVVDSRGLRIAGLSMTAACVVAVVLVLLSPQLAFTALARLVVPFGNVDWPRKTQLDLETPRERIGRNEKFEVRGVVRGVVPDKAVVIFKIDGLSQAEYEYDIASGSEPGTGALTIRLEPGRAQRSFSFQVRANDAVYQSKTITVSPPPRLVALDGKPSPQVNLRFPAYTDLPPQDLPPGTGTVEAVNGTVVTLRAAADRPLKRAWIEYQSEEMVSDLFTLLAPTVEAQLDKDCQTFSVHFQPRVSGVYELHFEDDSGLSNSALYELRVLADPSPTVTLERPSPSRDTLDMLPGAEFPLQALVSDPMYAIRTVYLEYRCKKDDPPRRLVIYDHEIAGLAAARAAAAATGGPEPNKPLKLRPTQLTVDQMVSLKVFQHLDIAGSALKDGDLLSLQLCADDFDDVTVDKQPGRSHEIEIRIISRNALDIILNEEERKVQQEMVRLEKLQEDARRKVEAVQKQLKQTGKLQPEDIGQLLEAEQTQQQIRERVGDKKEGLRAEAARILETLRNNHVPRTGTQERMERVQAGLDRLAREELPQIEPGLTNARKEAESVGAGDKDKERHARLEERAKDKESKARTRDNQARDLDAEAASALKQAAKLPDGDPKKPKLLEEAKQAKQRAQKLRQQAEQDRKDAAAIRRGDAKVSPLKESLDEARQHQEEVEKTLKDLLASLDPFASTIQIKGEAKSILEQQKALEAETQKLIDQGLISKDPKDLTNTEREKLKELREKQREVQERTHKLLELMDKVSKDRKDKDPETAKELEDARKHALESKEKKPALPDSIQDALDSLKENKLGEASAAQKQAIERLSELAKELEDRREQELDRLAKKLREKEKELEEIAQEQERLQKKARDIDKIKDPKKREEELRSLARQQRELKKKAEELAKQLSRMRQQRAGQALGRAVEQMERAGQQMEGGKNPDDDQEEALDRIDEAQEEVERAREAAEDQLAREQLAKIADVLKGFKDRQDGLIANAGDIQQRVLRKKSWEREKTTVELQRLAENQNLLGEDVADAAKDKLAAAKVFAQALRKCADTMKRAGERMRERYKKANEQPDDISVDEEANRLQKESLHRLEQLLEALKSETGVAARQRGRNGSGRSGGRGDGGSGGGAGDGIPPLAQLKLLKALQVDINKRTEEFAQQHPDVKKLTEKEQDDLQAIRREQQEVADLLEELTKPAEEPEGDTP